MKMSPTYGETTACEAFTNISTLIRICIQTCTGVPTLCRQCIYAHRRYTHYLMAPTYVFAVSRSLKDQSRPDESVRLVFFPSLHFFFLLLGHTFTVYISAHNNNQSIVNTYIDNQITQYLKKHFVRALHLSISYLWEDILFIKNNSKNLIYYNPSYNSLQICKIKSVNYQRKLLS